MDEQLAAVIKTLQTSEIALVRGDGAYVFRHGRWYDLTLTFFGWEKGIECVHFMTEERALQIAKGLLLGDPGHPVPLEVSDSFAREDPYWSYAHLLPFAQVSDTFAREVETKLLASPQDYLPLLERGSLGIGGGPTTDMQSITGYDATKQAAFLEALTRMMTTQKAGPYLKFYDAEV